MLWFLLYGTKNIPPNVAPSSYITVAVWAPWELLEQTGRAYVLVGDKQSDAFLWWTLTADCWGTSSDHWKHSQSVIILIVSGDKHPSPWRDTGTTYWLHITFHIADLFYFSCTPQIIKTSRTYLSSCGLKSPCRLLCQESLSERPELWRGVCGGVRGLSSDGEYVGEWEAWALTGVCRGVRGLAECLVFHSQQVSPALTVPAAPVGFINPLQPLPGSVLVSIILLTLSSPESHQVISDKFYLIIPHTRNTSYAFMVLSL